MHVLHVGTLLRSNLTTVKSSGDLGQHSCIHARTSQVPIRVTEASWSKLEALPACPAYARTWLQYNQEACRSFEMVKYSNVLNGYYIMLYYVILCYML